MIFKGRKLSSKCGDINKVFVTYGNLLQFDVTNFGQHINNSQQGQQQPALFRLIMKIKKVCLSLVDESLKKFSFLINREFSSICSKFC